MRKFKIGQLVYFSANQELCGYVSGILERPGSVVYFVSVPTEGELSAYDFELTTERKAFD